MANAPTFAQPDLSERFGFILDGLCRAAALRASRTWIMAPLVLQLWPYLRRLARRFDALLARVHAGRPARIARARPTAERTAAPVRNRLPSGHGWLLHLLPGAAAAYRSQLQHLLSEPEIVALLKTEPQAGRLLRPLCRMLGLTPGPDLPAALFRPAPAPSSTPPAAPAAAPLAPGPASDTAAGPPAAPEAPPGRPCHDPAPPKSV